MKRKVFSDFHRHVIARAHTPDEDMKKKFKCDLNRWSRSKKQSIEMSFLGGVGVGYKLLSLTDFKTAILNML